jgi:hypothetical protein
MELTIKKCIECGGTSFIQASDLKLLRSVEKSFTRGCEMNFTVCTACGEIISLHILHPGKMR